MHAKIFMKTVYRYVKQMRGNSYRGDILCNPKIRIEHKLDASGFYLPFVAAALALLESNDLLAFIGIN